MKLNLSISVLIIIILTSWMVVGSVAVKKALAEEPEKKVEEKALPTVRVRESHAEEFAAKLTLRGKTEAARYSTLKAEVAGTIKEIVAKRGFPVAAGQTIMRLDAQNLPEQLEAAKALVAQRKLEFDGAQKLQSTGYQSETRLAETDSLYAQARNQLAATQIALDNTLIKAPFDGVFNDRLVEQGEWVGIGDPVATFLQLDPMIVTAEATEQEIQKIKVGQSATAKIGDQSVNGSIRYISSAANQAVRTYTVEMEFSNSDQVFQAGLTADILLETATQLAHKVTPAVLFLSANTNGELGIKTVDTDGVVTFHKATIIGNADEGVWVGGLPATASIITVGQGFVKPGLKVNAVAESEIN